MQFDQYKKKKGHITLESDIKKLSDLSSTQQSINSRLKTIFDFYTKIIVNSGPCGDFGRISEESKIMTEGKLMIFFRQFGILDEKLHHLQQNQIDELRKQNALMRQNYKQSNYTHKWWLQNTIEEDPLTEYKKLPFKMLHAEFLKISNYSKIINFDQFLLLLNRVAQLMFANYINFDEKFYQFLSIDTNSYKLKMKQVLFPFNSKPSQLNQMLSPPIKENRSESLSTIFDYSISKQPEILKSQSIILSTEKTIETDVVQRGIKRRLPQKLSSIVREREQRKSMLSNNTSNEKKSEILSIPKNGLRSHSQVTLINEYFEMPKNKQYFEKEVFKQL